MNQQQSRSIRECAIGIYDGPHATPSEADEGPIFLGIKNITDDGRLDFSQIRHVSEQEYPRWTKRVVPTAGDMVFTYEATLHRYALIPEGFRGCLGRRVALVRPQPDLVDSRYLLYHCLSHSWRRKVEGIVINGATVDRIPLEKFPELPVRLPQLEDQKRIADILSSYDDLIANNEKRIALLERSARLLFEEWFVRLRYPGHERDKVIDGIPVGWENKPLAEFCSRITDGSHFSPVGTETGKPMASVKDMREWDFELSSCRLISEEDYVKLVAADCKPLKGDILIAKDGANLNKHTFLVTADREMVLLSSIAILRPREHVSAEYLVSMLRSDQVSERIKRQVSGAAIPRIVLKDFKNLPVVVPPRAIQQQWELACFPYHQLCRALFRQNTKLKNARDLLLPRLMDGRIAV